MLWRPALTSRASPCQSSRGLSPCISPRWRLALRSQTPEDLLLGDREGPGFRLGRGVEVRTARLLSPVDRDILEGLQFTRADGADVWTAVHRRLPDAWPQVFRPPVHERLVGVEWRVWATTSPCPPEVVLPRRTSHPSWETVAVLLGWVAVRETGGLVFTAPRGTVIETDGGTALQLAAEPLTTHVVVAVLQWGADRPQPWRDLVAGAVWRDLPVLRAAVWPGGAERHLPLSCGAPWSTCTPSPGTTSWWPRTMAWSSATTWSRWQPTWCSAWPPTP